MIIPRDENGIAHVVALSGGKDSTCLAVALKEKTNSIEYLHVCTPTGDELPDMIEHWRSLGERLGSTIWPVTSGHSLHSLIRKERALPNNRMRWCTRKLKLEPYYRWLATIAPCVSYVGLRADESSRSGMLFQEANGVEMRFPLQEWGWGLDKVWNFLDEREIKIPPRTDCARCYHQRLGEWWRLWSDHPEIYADAEQDEAYVSEERGKKHTFRNASRDTWPAALTELRHEFERGRIPRNTNRTDDLFSTRADMCRVCSL